MAADTVSIGVKWNYFDRFDSLSGYQSKGGYLPDYGEGETMATQTVTAVNKIVYKWYNDGDVFDNTAHLKGWANDLSDYANWLYNHVPGADEILDAIYDCRTQQDYESMILKPLADAMFQESLLKELNESPKVGSIYDCDGPYEFIENRDDDEDEDEDHSYHACDEEEEEEEDE